MAVTSPAVGDPATASWADSVAAALADSGWITPTQGNSWTSTGVSTSLLQYRKFLGVVFFTGGAKSGVVATTVFTLPAGFRPIGGIRVTTNSTGVGAATIQITSAGAVSVANYVTGGSNTEVNFNGVTFIADA